ncbi:MAG: helix-turn-helix domain-containing protein [Planctomycetota bacterium]|jgi:hypothetical protein
MPKSGEFYSFDEVLGRMNIDEQKLKKLVSEGEIRAFREGADMKFRKQDIDSMNQTRPIGGAEDATAAIDLSAGGAQPSETLTDDLIFDEGDDVTDLEAGMATAEISSQDTFVDEGVGMSTEPLDVDDGDEPATMEVAPAGSQPARAAAAMPSGRRPRAAVEEKPMEIGWILAMCVSAMLLVGGVLVSWDIGRANQDGSQAGGLAKWVGENLGGVDAPK